MAVNQQPPFWILVVCVSVVCRKALTQTLDTRHVTDTLTPIIIYENGIIECNHN